MCKKVFSSVGHSIKDILTLYWSKYLHDPGRRFYLSDYHLKTINTIRCCQTAKLGLHQFGCTCCGDTYLLPRSCKNRFCNRCGMSDTMDWIKKISSKLPDIKHHHVVFTLPTDLRGLCKQNKSVFYNLLFRISRDVIVDFFESEHRLQPGIISVLHTNGSDLKYHPHVHMIVSGGGLNRCKELKELEKDYLVAQRKLANRFRDKFISSLRELHKKQVLKLTIGYQNDWFEKLNKLSDRQWIMNIDAPLIGVEKIISYVGRYTKKSCLSERRILSIDSGLIRISYKDYKNSKRGEQPKENQLTLTSTQFLDRLMEHIPAKGFKVVRYYGMYSSSNLKYIPDDRKVAPSESQDKYVLSELEELRIKECPFRKYRQQMMSRMGKDPLYCYECHQNLQLIEIKYENSAGQIKYVKVYDSG